VTDNESIFPIASFSFWYKHSFRINGKVDFIETGSAVY